MMAMMMAIHTDDKRAAELYRVLSRVRKKKAMSLFGGLNVQSFGIPIMCADKKRWRFVIPTGDSSGEGGNLLAPNYLVGETEMPHALLIPIYPFYAHILSNAINRSILFHSFDELSRLYQYPFLRTA